MSDLWTKLNLRGQSEIVVLNARASLEGDR